MNLQEAINELEKGHRTFKAFEFVLDMAKTIQNSQKEFKAAEGQIIQTKVALSDLAKEKETVLQEIKDLKTEAKKIIDDAKAKAQSAADKITDAANADADKVRGDIATAEASLKKTREEVDALFKAKGIASAELDEINTQIATLKTNLKKLMGG